MLVSRGLLHEDVFFDAPFALELAWAKIGPILDQWQAAANDPGVWENVAWLGKRNEVWRQTKCGQSSRPSRLTGVLHDTPRR